ncbi:hypothetical protein EV715DRAFT_215477, partial [Schizophyllum commune]
SPTSSRRTAIHALARQKHFLLGFRLPPTTPKRAVLLSTKRDYGAFRPSSEFERASSS